MIYFTRDTYPHPHPYPRPLPASRDPRHLDILDENEYTTAIVSITTCLAHVSKKCTQSVNFPFDIKSPSDFKILSARKLKTLFQKYKLQLTTGIQACMGHVLRKYIYGEFLKETTTADSHENVAWKSEFIFFSCSILIIPTRLLCQMQADFSGVEFLSIISKFMNRICHCLFTSFNKTFIFTGSSAVDGKKMYKKKRDAVQSCWLSLH